MGATAPNWVIDDLSQRMSSTRCEMKGNSALGLSISSKGVRKRSSKGGSFFGNRSLKFS